MTEIFNAQGTLERFVALTKLAKLKRRQKFDDEAFPALAAQKGEACERAVRYSTECIAQELYKLDPEVFETSVQRRFAAVGRIVDNHVRPGPEGINQRRALIDRAREFASFSPDYHEAPDETDDNEGIAKRLNASHVSAAVSKFVLAREIGGRGLRPPKDLHDVDKAFTAESARELTDKVGHLHQEISTLLRSVDNLFSSPVNNLVASRPGDVRREIVSVSRQLDSRPVDPTLARVDEELHKERERVRRAVLSDTFPSSPSPPSSPIPAPLTSVGMRSLRRRREDGDEGTSARARRQRVEGTSASDFQGSSGPQSAGTTIAQDQRQYSTGVDTRLYNPRPPRGREQRER